MYQSENQKKFLRKKKKENIIIKIIQISLIIILFLSWEILTKKEILNSFIYSSPSQMIKTIENLIITNNLFPHIFTTLYEVLIAFILGIILGFLIAIIFYEYPFIANIFEPFLTILNALPKVALGPIIIIIFLL